MGSQISISDQELKALAEALQKTHDLREGKG
jgi:hypothetical protein